MWDDEPTTTDQDDAGSILWPLLVAVGCFWLALKLLAWTFHSLVGLFQTNDAPDTCSDPSKRVRCRGDHDA